MEVIPEDDVSHGGHRQKTGRKKVAPVAIEFSPEIRAAFKELAEARKAVYDGAFFQGHLGRALDLLVADGPKKVTPELIASIWDAGLRSREEVRDFEREWENPERQFKLEPASRYRDAFYSLNDLLCSKSSLHYKQKQSGSPMFTVVERSQSRGE